MNLFINYRTFLFSFLFIFNSSLLFCQFYNIDVEAKINLEDNNEFIKISSSANNKTEISFSVRYVLSVIKTDPSDGIRTKNDQSGRIVLQPSETKELSSIVINSTKTNRIVILLLIYDTENNIIGKDRILLNSGKNEENIAVLEEDLGTKENNKASSEDVQNEGKDGIYLLRGIVVEDTKTKPGRDFFKIFSTSYINKKINGERAITVTEVFALGRNTKIEVKAEEELIFQFFLKPNESFLKDMSSYAIEFVERYFKRLRSNKQQIRRY